MFFLLIFNIVLLWDLLNSFMDSFFIVVNNASTSIIHFFGFYRYFLMTRNYSLVHQLQQFLNANSFRPNEPYNSQLRLEMVKYCKKFTIVSLTVANMCILLWYIFPLYENQKLFPTPIYIPFNYESVYYFLYVLVCISVHFSAINIVVGSCTLCSFMPLLNAELMILCRVSETIMSDFQFVEGDEQRTYKMLQRNIKEIAVRHNDILKWEFFNDLIFNW